MNVTTGVLGLTDGGNGSRRSRVRGCAWQDTAISKNQQNRNNPFRQGRNVSKEEQ